MKTYRLEVYGQLNGVECHLFGRENITLKTALHIIRTLNLETYQLIEEDTCDTI